jgi:AhpC/TSA family
LTVLGVTTEDKKDTESWIKSKGVKYAYAYDKGARMYDKLGVEGIPHSFLMDPSGKIIWEGHPMELTPELIEQALKGALPKPLFDFPASASAVKNAVTKHNYAVAITEAGKLSDADGGPGLKQVVEGIVASRIGNMKAALKDGDLLSAQEQANALKKELEGLPEAPEPDKVLAEIKGNKDSERILAGQKKVRAMEDKVKDKKITRKADLEKLIGDLDKMAKDYSGTYVAKEAEETRALVVKRQNAK